MSSALASEFPTTGPPGRSLCLSFWALLYLLILQDTSGSSYIFSYFISRISHFSKGLRFHFFFFFWRITFRNQTLGSKWEIPEFWRKFSSYVLTALLPKCGLWPQQTEASHDKHGPKSLSPKGRKRFVSFAGEVSQRVWLRAQDEGFGARAHIVEIYCPWSEVLSFPLGRLPTCLKLSHPETVSSRNVEHPRMCRIRTEYRKVDKLEGEMTKLKSQKSTLQWVSL